MDLATAIDEIRHELFDLQDPYLWEDSELCSYIQTTLNELCSEFPFLLNTNFTINITSGVREYPLNNIIVKIINAKLESANKILAVVPIQDMFTLYPNWVLDDKTGGSQFLVVDYIGKRIFLDKIPETDDTLRLVIQHLPDYDYTTNNTSKYSRVLELPDHIIRTLCYPRIKSLAYLKDDTETYNINKAQMCLQLYTKLLDNYKRQHIKTIQIDRNISYHSGIL